MMFEKTSCPSCGAEWDAGEGRGAGVAGPSCPACGWVDGREDAGARLGLGESPGDGSASVGRPATRHEAADTAAGAEAGEPAGTVPQQTVPQQAAPQQPAPQQTVLAPLEPARGEDAKLPPSGSVPVASPSVGSADPGAKPSDDDDDDDGSARDGTVGDFATLSPAVADAALNWQEGLLIADRFRIIRFIGQGGMGKVFLARDETLARQVALKCVPQEIIFDGDARDDLRQEANRLLDLAHDNIVRIHTYYDGPSASLPRARFSSPAQVPPGGRRGDGWPFFAMEYLQGPTLKKLLRLRKQAGRGFTVKEVLLVASQVSRGLAHAHSKGIIHRDLKPGNLMLAEEPGEELKESDVVKITDFGVSRVIADSTLRQTGKRSGTLPYMSPEQFRGEPCTAQCDVYSFACALYELLAGKPPFHTGDIGYQILNKPAAPLAATPRFVGDAILRGLSKDPRNRYPSVESFLKALEGDPRPSKMRLRPTSRAMAVLSSMAAGVFLVGALLAGGGYLRGRGQVNAVSLRPKAQAQTEAQQQATEELKKRLPDELAKQIPFQIGRDFPGKTASTPDTISLRFELAEPRSSSHQRSLLERLVLQYHGENAQDKKETLHGTMAEGMKVFQLDGLGEGLYSLKAYLERTDGSVLATSEPFMEEPHKFRVDLTPPSFEVVPVQPDSFIDSNPPLRRTFDEVVDLKLVSARDPGDIAEVYAALALGDATLPWVRLAKLPFWRVELPPGVTTTYRVYAKDAAGNRSAATEVSFRRLKLEVESFGLALPDGVSGNLATVKGTLRVEGDQCPALKYFIKDRPVEPEGASSVPFGDVDRAERPAHDPSGIPFSAVLKLPDVTNMIEVRYAWKDNPAQPFALARHISDVKVRAPRVILAEVPRRTAEARVRLEGRVEPYFDGLDVSLERKSQGSHSVSLLPNPTSTAASFSQEVQLAEGENTFLLGYYYKGDAIVAAQQALSIYCDKAPPGVDGIVRFDPVGDSLEVSIRATEELSQLRIEEWTLAGESGAWRAIEQDLTTLVYAFTAPIPLKPVTLRIEMTDLAGNIGRSEQLCPIMRASREGGVIAKASALERSGVVPAVKGAISATDITALDVAGRIGPAVVPGLTAISSSFVQEMSMEFVPFGQERLEMCRTEVPERVWFRFLREKGYGYRGSGETGSPMVLEDYSPELLKELAKWFEESSNDGYTYEVPGKDQWLMAFAGVNDPDRAREAVAEWFRGSLKGRRRFAQSPACRYGTNDVSAIGSRKENRTPSDLFDMESNVQEVVLDGDSFKVIGGSNKDSQPAEMLTHCLDARPYDAGERLAQGRITGFRLMRRPLRLR